MILGLETVTRRRYATGSFTAGRWVNGASSDTSISMSVQPLTDRELQTLPEGERTSENLKGYTTADVRTGDEESSPVVVADRIQVRGAWFEVRQVEEQRAVLPHKKVRLLRLLETDG